MQFAELDKDGFLILENILDVQIISNLTRELSELNFSNVVRRKNKAVYGVRNLLNISPKIREFSQCCEFRKIAEDFLGQNAKVVRAIFFDKTAEASWKVPWHQDLTIAVREKRESEGFLAWTRKAGIHHVQPPIGVLEKMLTLRFHLDDADETNGTLKVIPESHRKGRLSAEEIKIVHQANESHVCSVKKGDCLIMRPLLLHASSAGSNPKNRRVVHFELAADELPNGLKWYDS